MANRGYKKYMKNNVRQNDYSLLQLFAISFFGALLVITILIKSFSQPVDVSIGDYKADNEVTEEAQNIDGRLAVIQDEDRGRDFAELMKSADDIQRETETVNPVASTIKEKTAESSKAPAQNPIYKVYIGAYTSAEQAKVAKDIIQDSGAGITPIVKCIGSNNYTLQVGIFTKKTGAEALLTTLQQNHLPARIVQEY